MQSKEYKLPNGKTAVFEYDANGVGKVSLECMDELMAMIADRPQGEWIVRQPKPFFLCTCSVCGETEEFMTKYCPNCGARMKGADDGEDIQSADE
jgi:hypothetical protein